MKALPSTLQKSIFSYGLISLIASVVIPLLYWMYSPEFYDFLSVAMVFRSVTTMNHAVAGGLYWILSTGLMLSFVSIIYQSYRDVPPENFFLNDGAVKICYFGISVVFDCMIFFVYSTYS